MWIQYLLFMKHKSQNAYQGSENSEFKLDIGQWKYGASQKYKTDFLPAL